MGDVPEVTMVHPRAEAELPASICESNSFAPGSAIGPPSMTASSKRMMAAYFVHKNHEACDEQSSVLGAGTLPPAVPPNWDVERGIGKTYFDLLGGFQMAQLPERFRQPPSVSIVSGAGAVEAV